MVLFHRNHPAASRVLLQVPTGPETAETFVIDLNQLSQRSGEYDPRTDHKGWMKRLPNSQALMDKLACDPHVAYYIRRNGTSMVLENPDEIPWVRQVMAMARMEAPDSAVEARFRQREVRTQSRAPSLLRRLLGLRPGGVSW